jgi:excisionase family DNA binding protein
VNNAQYRDLPEKSLLTPGDVALFLSISLKTVYRWHRSGTIRGIKLKGSLRIYRDSILNLFHENNAPLGR